ncbi:MAG: hypothetical protein ACLQQ4_18455 [Bacteroidia bacterium]
MRYLATLFIALLMSGICLAQSTTEPCPPEGKAISDIGKHVNILKNRDITQGTVNPNIVLDSILKGMPEDTGRYKSTDFVTITGYVLGADDEGPESCNCFSKEESKQNLVLYIGNSPLSGKDSVFFVEITPKFKAKNPEFMPDALFGQKVTISGYMMYNFEMKKMALNACKKCRTTDRKTAWEICPVTDITLIPKQTKKS